MATLLLKTGTLYENISTLALSIAISVQVPLFVLQYGINCSGAKLVLCLPKTRNLGLLYGVLTECHLLSAKTRLD